MIKTTHEDNHSFIHSGRSRRAGGLAQAFKLLALTLTLGWCWEAHAQQAATAIATVTNGSVASIEVTSGGSGYASAPTITFVGGGGAGASAVAEVIAGTVRHIIVQSPGSGFTSAPLVMISPPPLTTTPATLTIGMVPKLILTAQAWTVQEIQYTDKLNAANPWTTLTNAVMGQSPFVFIDADTLAGTRYYRAVTLEATGPDPARWAWINPGTFLMGSPPTEYDRSADESPQTEVTFSRGFWVGRFEVTESEYSSIIGTNHSTVSGPNQPVEQVTWFDATNYCAHLTFQEQAAGRTPPGYVYRLPTEAEWEYVTRAGTTTRFFFGDDHTYTLLPNYAWFSVDSGQITHDVGGKLPNQWGLYDTSGNVWEWCADLYGPYSGGAVTDPTGASSGIDRVMRGGSAFFEAGDSRSADRSFNPPDFQSHGIGFRVVLGPPLR